MADETRILTVDGKNKLEAELNELKTVTRLKVVQDIAEARAHGDLSENAEYDEAKNEEARVHGRIKELEEILAHATIVDDSELDSSVVSVGSIVKVYDYDFDEEAEYTLVGFSEANPMENKVSTDSPIGKALNGARVNEEVEADTPGGIVKLKILSVTRR